jgi:hypothetical protein|tara:strand:- start:22 stop:240 length:219 start_codon:yes stop_codon:yes gene_type:complete
MIMKKTELCHPTKETWFICWDDTRTTIKVYGSILPTQCMDTPWNEVDYYTDESEWLAILLENGIKPDELIKE